MPCQSRKAAGKALHDLPGGVTRLGICRAHPPSLASQTHFRKPDPLPQERDKTLSPSLAEVGLACETNTLQ